MRTLTNLFPGCCGYKLCKVTEVLTGDTWETLKSRLKDSHFNESRCAVVLSRAHLNILGPLPRRCEVVVESKTQVVLNMFVKNESLGRERRLWGGRL